LLLTCALFAAGAWVKPILTVLPPLLIAASGWLWSGRLQRAFPILLIASLVYFGVLTPWWIRNFALLHTFVPFTTGAAQNLYLGNNANNPYAGIDRSTDVEPTFAAQTLTVPNEIKRQQIFSDAARRWIVSHPSAFLDRTARKFIRFWNIFPNAAEFKTGLFPIISALSFGPVLMLAIFYGLRRGRLSTLFPMYCAIGYFTLVYTVTIASLRYRLPLESFLIAMAAVPLSTLLRWMLGLSPAAPPKAPPQDSK
jgi:hypothetical protein